MQQRSLEEIRDRLEALIPTCKVVEAFDGGRVVTFKIKFDRSAV